MNRVNRAIAVIMFCITSTIFLTNILLAEQPMLACTDPSSPACNKSEKVEVSPEYIAYYFHGTRRCMTCNKIEANAKRVIETEFAKEIEAGTLVLRIVNFDEPANKHFIDDFKLYASSLVIVSAKSDAPTRSAILDKVWPLAHSGEDFDRYVGDEIRKFIGATNG